MHRVTGAPLHIDHAGMALGAIADQAVRAEPRQIDADRDAFADVGVVGIHQPLARMQVAQRLGAEQRMAAAESDLRQPRTLAHEHGKGERADLGIKRPVVAGLDTVEAAHLVGDHAGEHVEPSGRAFRIGGRRNLVGQRQAFQQRHDIDAAGLQHGAVGEREFVQLQFVDTLSHRGRPGQEARAHAIGHLAQPQIEARRLDLVGHEIGRWQNPAVGGQRRDHAVGQNALVLDGECEWHGFPSRWKRRSNPMGGLTGSGRPRYKHLIPWSFEPAGLQPRKINR